MGYTRFQPTARRGRTEDNSQPLVTMRSNGVLHLNTRAYEDMGEPEFVTLLVDEDSGNFAIQPVAEKESGEYILTVRQPNANQNGYDLSSQSFMREIGYINGSLRKFAADWNESEGLLEVRLENEIERPPSASRATGRRRRSARNGADGLVEFDELEAATV